MAKMKTCHECKAEIPADANKCMHCGSKQKKKTSLLTWLVVALLGLIILPAMFGPGSHTTTPSKSPEQIKAERQAAMERKQKHEAAIKADFEKNKTTILGGIRKKIDAGNYDAAVRQASAYRSLKDTDLDALYVKAREQSLLAQVKKVPSSDLQKNLNLYNQLLAIAPGNVTYKKKRDSYKAKINKLEVERAARIIAFGNPPVRSAWDGSYAEVERYLKIVANDPDSIDIDKCTQVYHTKSGWLVGCVYRGKNGFGAMVRNANWFTIVKGRVTNMEPADKYKW